jgi:hypothetical protein
MRDGDGSTAPLRGSDAVDDPTAAVFEAQNTTVGIIPAQPMREDAND